MKKVTSLLAIIGCVPPLVLPFIIPDGQLASQLFLNSKTSLFHEKLKEAISRFEKVGEVFEHLGEELENVRGLSGHGGNVMYDGTSDLDKAFEEALAERSGSGAGNARNNVQALSERDLSGEAWVTNVNRNLENFSDVEAEHHRNGKCPHKHNGEHDGSLGESQCPCEERPRQPHGDHGHDGFAPERPIHEIPMPKRDEKKHLDETIWDLISKCEHTKIFFKLADKDEQFKNMLKDEKGNFTLFVPTDCAFKKIFPDGVPDDKHLPKEKLHNMLFYHTAPGTHHSDDLIHRNTLISGLGEPDLGKEVRQRLRIGLDVEHGPTVNFLASIVLIDSFTKNGVIHGIDHVLFPPPPIADLLTLLPSEFSTTVTALYKTKLMDEVEKYKGKGLTVWAPSNGDWGKLGFKANAWLFSSAGEDCLKSLMKYHISPKKILYSDALVEPKKEKKKEGENMNVNHVECEEDPHRLPEGYTHVSLESLLGDKKVYADISRYKRALSFQVNGMSTVIISDGLAKDGVIQVPNHILLPPNKLKHGKHGKHHDDDSNSEREEREVSVEELKERLLPLVEAEKEREKELEL